MKYTFDWCKNCQYLSKMSGKKRKRRVLICTLRGLKSWQQKRLSTKQGFDCYSPLFLIIKFQRAKKVSRYATNSKVENGSRYGTIGCFSTYEMSIYERMYCVFTFFIIRIFNVVVRSIWYYKGAKLSFFPSNCYLHDSDWLCFSDKIPSRDSWEFRNS